MWRGEGSAGGGVFVIERSGETLLTTGRMPLKSARLVPSHRVSDRICIYLVTSVFSWLKSTCTRCWHSRYSMPQNRRGRWARAHSPPIAFRAERWAHIHERVGERHRHTDTRNDAQAGRSNRLHPATDLLSVQRDGPARAAAASRPRRPCEIKLRMPTRRKAMASSPPRAADRAHARSRGNWDDDCASHVRIPVLVPGRIFADSKDRCLVLELAVAVR